MRFKGRGLQENGPNNVDDADIVVQIGPMKTGLKAAQLIGANIQVSRSPDSGAWTPSDSLPTPTNDHEDKALEALSQMQDALSPRQFGRERCGPWSPYSPDDAYPYTRQPNQLPSNVDSETLPRLCREPSDAALHAYYDPVEHPYYISQQTSASAVRDMALHKGAPTIFENVCAPPARTRFSTAPHLVDDNPAQDQRVRRSSTKTQTKTRSRALDLVNLFPHPRSSTVPSRTSQSPATMADLPLPPTSDHKLRKSKAIATSSPGTDTSSGPRASRPFDEAILDQHKTNVRRPPKGIQNWFDAYLDDDDEDEEDVVDEADEPEPQELPGDDVLPPAYTGPNRRFSRASDKSAHGPRTPHDSHHPPQQAVERALEQARLNRSSHSSRSNSIQSSHLGSRRQAGQSIPAYSTLGQESVLSLSESEYEDEEDDLDGDMDDEEMDEDEDEQHHGRHGRARADLPAIRDSILDDRNIMVANASTLDVVRVPKPTQLHGIRLNHHPESKPSSARSSLSSPSTQRRDKTLPIPHSLPSHQEQPESNPIAADPIALRRLNGLSLESAYTTGTTDTSNTGLTGETHSSGTSYHDMANGSSQDAMHMVAITEEERMLLDLMRQKRVAMQQMSFTEGYQLALRTEQQRLAKRAATAEERALKHLKKEGIEQYRTGELSATSHTPTQESEMRRQLSAIRKEQVDDRFQMERFLDMSRPAPLSSHPPDAPQGRRKPRAPSGEVLPATRYSPATYASPGTTTADKSGYFSADDCETESVRLRVKQFISSKGAVPPLNSGMKTMRRHTIRQPSSVPPLPVPEDDQNVAPALPPRSPERITGHSRDLSYFTVSTLTHKPSSSSLHDEPRDRSPVSAFSGRFFPGQAEPPLPLSAYVSCHDTVLLPPRPEGPSQGEYERELSKSSSQPHLLSHNVPRLPGDAASPFANLINAASRVNPAPSPIASLYMRPRTASSTDVRSVSAHGGVHQIDIARSEMAAGKQPLPRLRDPLPRLNTADSVYDSRASMLSITSAGEEVLNAWGELGGGKDCLRTKTKHHKLGDEN